MTIGAMPVPGPRLAGTRTAYGDRMQYPDNPHQSDRAPSFHPISWLLFLLDVGGAFVAVFAALALRLETTDPMVALSPYLPLALLPVVIRPIVLAVLGLYQREWKYASVRELVELSLGVAIGSMLIVPAYIAAAFVLIGPNPVPRSFLILEPIVFLGVAAATRLLIRAGLERRASMANGDTAERVIVYGAGNAGAIVGRMAATGALPGIRVVGYLDDDPRKKRSRLLGHRVFGGLDDLGATAEQTGARQVIVAIPSATPTQVRRAVEAARAEHLEVRIVPPLRDFVTGTYQVSGIRKVSVEDLLGREPVSIDADAIRASINGKSVVVTGGGGSIGGELVRQILSLGPRELTIVENHEWALWSMERDIASRRRESDGTKVIAALADVRSTEALIGVLRRARPDVVFHAAALKHVPYVELYPAEGVLTNVVGTRNVLRACEQLGVPRFVLISTDKAVEPVSVMGATKRLAEHLTVAAGLRTGNAYTAVRFGNVLGSSGSIVPLLQRQLDDGLPLTITEPNATRYFMTIAEAVSLILEAGADPIGGEVYVLDMGEPVRIMDLARDLVQLNGLDPDRVRFTVTGLRPGERVHEKLFYDDETAESTHHPGILRAHRGVNGMETDIEAFVDELAVAAREHNDQAVRSLLSRTRSLTGMTVPERHHSPASGGIRT
jgi:FlaA1/EpsC-like NDP-sugar epimerase